MTDLAAAPAPLPSDPLRTLPGRPAGSARRTTSVDILRPDGLAGDAVVIGRGRDLWTDPDEQVEVRDHSIVELRIDYAGERLVRSIWADPQPVGIVQLVGARSGSGFRGRVAEALPDEVDRGSLLHQLLDDVPGLTLIGGYASTITEAATTTTRSIPPQVDMCAGWQRQGTMVSGITQLGRIPLLAGPIVGPFTGGADPAAWHAMPDLPPLAMRRHRLLEVTPGPRIGVTSWFRDVFRSIAGEDIVVHEYSLSAQVDPDSFEIIDVDVRPRVLPWLECPQAVPSSDRLRGADTQSLRSVVRRDFTGTATCTHLNDQYRSLADIRVLSRPITH